MKDAVIVAIVVVQVAIAVYGIGLFYNRMWEISLGNISTTQPHNGPILFER